MDKHKIMENSLNMDELEQVSGGSDAECMGDMGIFLSYNIIPFRGSQPTHVTEGLLEGLEAAFSIFGVEVKLRKNNKQGCDIHNRYYIKGKLVSREEAWAHVAKQDPKKFWRVFNPEDGHNNW